MNKFIALSILCIAFFSSCSNNAFEKEDSNGLESSTPILLQSAPFDSRAGISVQNTQFERNEKINVYIFEKLGIGEVASTIYNNPIEYYTTNLSGAMAPTRTIYPYYPSNGRNVNMYAVYPNGVLSTTTSFTVQEDQTLKAYYKASDLMYASANDVERSANIIPLSFNHLMTKVIVELSVPTGKDANILNGAIVKLKNVMRTVEVDVPNGTLGSVSNSGDVLLTNDGSEPSAGIIVPQTIQAGHFLEIRLENGDILNYNLPQSLTFSSGKKNIFGISINETVISAKFSVVAWDDQEPIETTLSLDD